MKGETPASEGAQNFVASVEDKAVFTPITLPPELMPTPVAKGGGRYDKLPTHYQDSDDEIGRVWWRTEPGVETVTVSPRLEGSLLEDSSEFLVRRSRWDQDGERIEELKPGIKEDLESIEDVTGLYFEQLGLGLTNIESISVRLRDENGLRESLGPEFYELVDQQTATVKLKLEREVLIKDGKPLTPELFIQVVSLAMDIMGIDLQNQADILSSGSTTRVDKRVARRLWQQGKIGKGDVEFVKSYALTPDSMPRTAIKKSPDPEV